MALLATTLLVVTQGQRIRLVADGDVDVGREPVVGDGAPIVGRLRRGDDVPVLRCTDTKHYVLPEIRMADGRTGYVVGPLFHMRRGAMWSDLDAPVVFTCGGL